MKNKYKWHLLALSLMIVGALVSGCSKPEEPHTEGDGHNHKPGEKQ